MITVIRDKDGGVKRVISSVADYYLDVKTVMKDEAESWTERQCRIVKKMSIDLKFLNKGNLNS